jgi:hypothetical protein
MTSPKSRLFRPLAILIACGMLLSGTSSAWALITGSIGNDPIPDSNWPEGTLAIANLKNRLGWWEGPPFGGGEYHFLYRCDAKALNETLVLLSKIDAPVVEVEVHSGPQDSFWLNNRADLNQKGADKGKLDSRIDWEFVVWTPGSYHRLFNHPSAIISADQPNFRQPIPAPKLAVYVGGGLIDWKNVQVPKNVKIVDHVTDRKPGVVTASLKGKVYNIVTSKPVNEATISLTKHDKQGKAESVQSVQTDKSGVFEIKDIPAAVRTVWYSLSVESEGLAARNLGYRTFEPGSTQNLTTYLSPLEKVQGRVVDDQDQPVVGAEVSAMTILGIDGKGYTMKDRPAVKTDAEGRFTIELPAGSVYMSCRSGQLLQKNFLKLHEVPTRDMLLEMEGTTTVTIRLINDQNQPISDKVVSLEPKRDPIGKWGGMSNTDAEGKVVFEGVPPGEYVIRPDGPNAKHTKAVTIRGGKPQEISFTTK